MLASRLVAVDLRRVWIEDKAQCEGSNTCACFDSGQVGGELLVAVVQLFPASTSAGAAQTRLWTCSLSLSLSLNRSEGKGKGRKKNFLQPNNNPSSLMSMLMVMFVNLSTCKAHANNETRANGNNTAFTCCCPSKVGGNCISNNMVRRKQIPI